MRILATTAVALAFPNRNMCGGCSTLLTTTNLIKKEPYVTTHQQSIEARSTIQHQEGE